MGASALHSLAPVVELIERPGHDRAGLGVEDEAAAHALKGVPAGGVLRRRRVGEHQQIAVAGHAHVAQRGPVGEPSTPRPMSSTVSIVGTISGSVIEEVLSADWADFAD